MNNEIDDYYCNEMQEKALWTIADYKAERNCTTMIGVKILGKRRGFYYEKLSEI